METNELEDKIQEIKKSLSDEGKVTELLLNLRDDTISLITNYKETGLTNKDLLEKNENLRKVNMDLFSRVGEKVDSQSKVDEGLINPNQELPKRSFKDILKKI